MHIIAEAELASLVVDEDGLREEEFGHDLAELSEHDAIAVLVIPFDDFLLIRRMFRHDPVAIRATHASQAHTLRAFRTLPWSIPAVVPKMRAARKSVCWLTK